MDRNHPRFTKNMNYLAKTYNKEVMVVEVGGEDSQVENTYKLLEATIKAVKKCT